jgi:outer membrane protein TolC
MIARKLSMVLALLPMTGSLAHAQQAGTSQPGTPERASSAGSSASDSLDLAGCIALALQRQPRLAVQRASLAASQDGQRGLDDLLVPTIIEPQLPVRRRQACLGVRAAAARLEQTERETVYAVTRTYFTVVYARQQEQLANRAVDRLGAVLKAAQDAVNAGAANTTTNDVHRTDVYTRLATGRRITASMGVERALAGLREAIGLGPEEHIDVATTTLPEPTVRPTREEIVSLAITRRDELVQAGIFADVTCLEVDAQGLSLHKQVPTFASGSDIHANQVPQEFHNNEYRPGAVPPEMPDQLVGPRQDRMRRARDFHERATAVVEVTRNLIALEAEDAFLQWQERALQTPELKAAAEAADSAADELSKQYTSRLKVTVEEVVTARVLASTTRSTLNEATYRQILALAELERATGGGFSAGLADLAVAGSPPAQPAAPGTK